MLYSAKAESWLNQELKRWIWKQGWKQTTLFDDVSHTVHSKRFQRLLSDPSNARYLYQHSSRVRNMGVLCARITCSRSSGFQTRKSRFWTVRWVCWYPNWLLLTYNSVQFLYCKWVPLHWRLPYAIASPPKKRSNCELFRNDFFGGSVVMLTVLCDVEVSFIQTTSFKLGIKLAEDSPCNFTSGFVLIKMMFHEDQIWTKLECNETRHCTSHSIFPRLEDH